MYLGEVVRCGSFKLDDCEGRGSCCVMQNVHTQVRR